ncbi:hypothetical protein BLS_009264 [Venturia inaequalis]|uniref:Glucose-methanol-choline oxidoreductase N-terminal domain-containing protein n=1 Tax=Venturia inaequalis TaxID=5025 RepID=A0A8H3YMX8_VENIN|nr:hypothetical protein BLS_009264 [Venturia inaequalis]
MTKMARTIYAAVAALTLGVQVQAAAYTDPNTGITFQGFTDTTGFQFGMALPTDPTTEFIAQIVSPLKGGVGWGGVSLNSAMANRLLVAAWPSGQNVVASFREANGYVSPAVYAGNATMAPIASGTFVNGTHVSFTFVCTNCMRTDDMAFKPTDSQATIGWAMSQTAVGMPSDPASVLSYHAAGFGVQGITLADAKSASYATWSAKAGTASASVGATTSTNITNSTTGTTNSTKPVTISNSTYDYIVAGAGPAGIIVAERLAESGASVLLIERGNASTYASGGRSQLTSWNSTLTQYDVPALAYYLDVSKAYCTDTASAAGCLLGGGTMVNALMFVRPQDRDFNDKWPTGWKWSDVKAASERLYARNPGVIKSSADGKYHDTGAYSILSTFLSSNGWKSVNALEKTNEKHQIFSHPPWDIQNGLRAGPVKSYLPLAKKLTNFKLLLLTEVVQAVRNGTTVSGVLTKDAAGNQQIINLKAGGKLILAAGALASPRILFNSGIGPSDQLAIVANGTTGVTLPAQSQWLDLPVGQNLKDHPIFTLTFNTKQNQTSMAQADFKSPSANNVAMFSKGAGPLAQSGQRLSFWTSINAANSSYKYFQGTCNSPSPGTIRIKTYLTHGLTSVGQLGITPAGATTFLTKPWLTTPEDKTALVDFSNSLLAMSRANTSTITSNTYTNGSLVTETDLLNTYTTGSHFVGTAKMQTSPDDANAVVDKDTKVLGMTNLFVVDASVHPDLPTGNTQAIVMVVAERAAERILALKTRKRSSRVVGR